MTAQRLISKLRIVNSLTSKLASDPVLDCRPRQVINAHFSFVNPEPTAEPYLACLVESVAAKLGLDPPQTEEEKANFLDILSGNKSLGESWALCYGGHQFGYWAGQLGDGRAISIGQVKHKNNIMELQLKGAGPTPYSRMGDGYAVLRSSIRELLASEAMYHLGVPTSRALSLVHTPHRLVQRERLETGAIVCRVAPSWIRFGNFEILYARNDYENLRKLADYTMEEVFGLNKGDYEKWLIEIVERTAGIYFLNLDMIAHWQAVGFCHGVMNTDNFSILGLTFDYGPFQFMDFYDPNYICNLSDETGRYAFKEQPRIALWNLSRLMSAISPLMHTNPEDESVTKILVNAMERFMPRLTRKYCQLMCTKFGLEESPEYLSSIVQIFLSIMSEHKLDYTLTIRSLSKIGTCSSGDIIKEWKSYSSFYTHASAASPSSTVDSNTFDAKCREWLEVYDRAIKINERKSVMDKVNPKFILRNHIVQFVIEKAENGDFSGVTDYLKVLENPYDEGTKEQNEMLASVPVNKKGMRCSCSS